MSTASPQNKKNAEVYEVYRIIKEAFGQDIYEKLTNVRAYYKDYHNRSYIGKLEDTWVQIRIPYDIVEVNHANEQKIIEIFKDYLYAKNGVLIKKWFPGVDLFKINIDEKISKAILHCVKNFQNLDVKLERFNWLRFNIDDPKYLELVKKYENEEYVLAHNNLKRQNILVNKYGFIKLVDFEFSSFNSRYFDPVSLHLFLGLNKDEIIEFFNLDRNTFDDYVYMVRVYNEVLFKNIYANLKIPNIKVIESLNHYNNRSFLVSNRFIIQKNNNEFDNKLDISKIEDLYFVPTCVYEDKDRIIWRWLNCQNVTDIKRRQMKVLAKAIKNLHDSDIEFPEYILEDKIEKLVKAVGKKQLVEDFNDLSVLKLIRDWLKEIKPDANCHNNLCSESIYFSENLNVYIIDWAYAYRSSRFLDIAFMFENLNSTKAVEDVFWNVYEYECPYDFDKYRVIVHFIAYLYNRALNGDYLAASINVKRIKELIVKLKKRD
ncbi:hypothetical protein FJM01_00270 [Mycoplasma struthionis]|uniref:Uncharacterized protein n=3 Tax=Mycoplasma struthionis TaxID=538220 RepID=A0A502M2V2_9MOLU|nr:hypothetical protein FJM01_00270 [Mycoplasma struthionis]